jgi:hypothetical protein
VGGRKIVETPLLLADLKRQAKLSLFLADLGPSVVTTCFIPISLDPLRLYLDQTYENVQFFYPIAPRLSDGCFEFEYDERPSFPGHAVLIGGSPEHNWYHWLINWYPRLVLARLLFPDFFYHADVRFVFHENVKHEPFSYLRKALFIPESRSIFITAFGPEKFEKLLVPTVVNQHFYSPTLLRKGITLIPKRSSFRRTKRIWINREIIPQPKRRVANFVEIMPILERLSIEPVVLEILSAEEQINLFQNAELIVGVHGAGLANLVFCSENTKALIIDVERNATSGSAGMSTGLAEIMKLEWELLVVEEEILEEVDYSNFHNLHCRDVIVDPTALEHALERLLSVRRRRRSRR